MTRAVVPTQAPCVSCSWAPRGALLVAMVVAWDTWLARRAPLPIALTPGLGLVARAAPQSGPAQAEAGPGRQLARGAGRAGPVSATGGAEPAGDSEACPPGPAGRRRTQQGGEGSGAEAGTRVCSSLGAEGAKNSWGLVPEPTPPGPRQVLRQE